MSNLVTDRQEALSRHHKNLAKLYDSQGEVSVGIVNLSQVVKVGDYVLVMRPEVLVGTELSPAWSSLTSWLVGHDDKIYTYDIDISIRSCI